MTTQFPVKDITKLIPQKAPFVMVDSLLDFSETKVESAFTILSNNLFVENNNFTEPGLVENMAQTVALHTGYNYYIKGEDAPTGYIGSIKKTTIKKLPKVNDVITTKVNVLHEIMGVTMVEIMVFNAQNEEIASAEMKTVIAS
ncbi:hypothetical protein [Neotamlana laminarinivorans]|uniref:FabZ n=1 Tax=Neotamlana laminarinivorans TaxID=2883124 RepID=A0A9X1I0D7_9FLAO|nr:hypothetical protein [Tamlana laminarinivorans]MCB4799489.1 hypothetical protein [Tamlana laminarinivorans]